jgi:hypothetical protein
VHFRNLKPKSLGRPALFAGALLLAGLAAAAQPASQPQSSLQPLQKLQPLLAQTAIPDHAHAIDDGTWSCDRGFERKEVVCVSIMLPLHAHLDRTGNEWACDRGFHLLEESCVRPLSAAH